MATKDYQAIVNPVYTTGKGTAFSLAASGNKDALSIVSKLDASELAGQRSEVPAQIKRGYAVALEARYEISNEMIRREGRPNIIDLPSGYTPRALLAPRMNMRYIGMDLPVVADDIGPIVKELIPDKYGDTVQYYGVDATNFDSMTEALKDVKGEVCIAMDGILGYFNEPELVSVCNNIKKILNRFGGSWITGDTTNIKIFSATFAALLKEDRALIDAFSANTASQMSDVKLGQNSLLDGGPEKALKFLNSMGFDVEKISYADLLPDTLISLANDPESLDALRAEYKEIEMWKITLNPDIKMVTEEVEDKEFGAVLNNNGGDLNITLSGRLDTITAPDLLEKYEKIAKESAVTKVTIDNKDLQYISSAGLRVLLIIYQALENNSNFKMINVNDDVREILETTGFDEYLL